MPEGDTVWNTARVLQRALAGTRLTRSDFRVPQLAATDLAGWTVRESASRGKHLLLRLAAPGGSATDTGALPGTDGGMRWTLHSHLRMDGAWRAYAPGERWATRPAHLIRVVLRSPSTVAVGYHLHDLALVPTSEEGRLVDHLGPDLLGPDWDPSEAVRRLTTRPATTIGEALLDQRNLAGVGNLYKCEVLFLLGVSPWTPVGAVPDLTAAVTLAQKLLTANRGRWRQSTTGSLHRGQTSYVYGRRAQPCRRCGTAIRKEELGDRVTYWCPTCQPGPEPSA
ncbi:zinc finger domain-containing protein [Micromonospora sp. WMMA1363]|uniref:zinc finger domain-containing protein n=1 Tax=Micromonospora sp. WMMA1363 TaxID=3053985 RepID=UPI00259CB0AE|nr:zinc finger domain-containing protein [Micromonospora sp. WMMA1363]MDM4723138.1 zinc finger domain-containing protein [Micromonospora sp. WMMA1363]